MIRLRPRETPQANPDALFSAIVHVAFQGRRKTLRNCLKRLPGATDERIADALTRANVAERERGERLGVDRFARLAEAWRASEPAA